MSFVNIARLGLSFASSKKRKASKEPVKFFSRVTELEDRTTPATVLLDHATSFLTAGNGTSSLLGSSQDGRYIIFSSTSTNLVDNQIDNPGTKDLFWADLLTGSIKLVTNLPTLDTSGPTPKYSFDGSTTFSRILPDDDAFSQAVISADGEHVAFTTKVNASLLDPTYLTKSQFAGATRVIDPDRSNSTFDVFRWSAKVDSASSTKLKVQLASRTYDESANRPSEAFGRTTNATDPAISADGTFVSFVSVRDAGEVLPRRNPNVALVAITDPIYVNIVQDSNASPDIFFTDMEGAPDSGGFYSDAKPPQFKTGILSYIRGNDVQFTFTVTPASGTTPAVTQTITLPVYNTIGSKGGFTFDPYGRYLDGQGTSIAITSPLDPALLNANPLNNSRTYLSRGQSTTSSNRDVYLLSSTATANLNNTVRLVSSTFVAPPTNPTSPQPAVRSLAFTGGNAENAIIAQGNSQLVLFVASTNANAPLIQGVSDNGNSQLYLRDMSSELGDTPILISSASKAPSATTPYVVGGRLQSAAETPDPAVRVTTTTHPLGYSISPDGRYVAFSNSAPAGTLSPVNAALGQTVPVNDTNNALDIFLKDTVTGRTQALSVRPTPRVGQAFQTGTVAAINPRVSATGRFVTFESTNTSYVNATDGNGTGYDAYVRDVPNLSTTLLNASAVGTASSDVGVVPGQTFVGSSSKLGYASLASAASNIDLRFPTTKGNVGIYFTDLQPATTGAVSNALQVGAIGANGQAALITFSSTGATVTGNRFTPFPGFAGEVRVAVGDVNNDGVQDLIVAAGPGGGPRVAVIDGKTGTTIRNFFAYEPSFRGGVNIAVADFDGDGSADIAVGAGEGGGPRVRVFRGSDNGIIADFFSFESSFRGGVRVATGDVGSISTAGVPLATRDNVPDLIVAAGEGGGPRITVYNGTSLRLGRATPITDFFAFEQGLRNGTYVAAGDFDLDGSADVVAGAGPGGGPRVKVFSASSLVSTPSAPSTVLDFFTSDTSSRNGVRVAVKNIDNDSVADIVAGEGPGLPPTFRTYAGGRIGQDGTPNLIDTTLAFNNVASFGGVWVG